MFSMENTFEAMRLILFGKRKLPSSPSTARCFRRFGGTGGLVVPVLWWYRYFASDFSHFSPWARFLTTIQFGTNNAASASDASFCSYSPSVFPRGK